MNVLPTLWIILLIVVLVWYTVVTLVVAFFGAFDIKNMLRELASRDAVDPDHKNDL